MEKKKNKNKIRKINNNGKEKKSAYRELHKTKDEHGPKAAKIRIGQESAEQGQQKYGADKVRHYIC